MNHPANQVFAAIKRIAEPEFSRKLTWDEQRALSPEAFARYTDWLFAFNEPATRRWGAREFLRRDRDREVEIERDDSYDAQYRQSGAENKR